MTNETYTPSSIESDVREWRGIGVVGYESALGGLYKNGETCLSVGGVARALVRVQDAAAISDATIADAERYRRIRYCRKFVGMLEFATAHADTDEQYDAAIDALPVRK